MTGNSLRPFGISPLVMAATICSGVQSPRPVSLSGVRLPPTKTPTPGIPNPTSEPASRRFASGFPRRAPGVWHEPQPAIVTRYLPRSIWVSAAEAADAPKITVATSNGRRQVRMFRSLDEVARVIRNKMRLSDAAAVGRWALDGRNEFTPAVQGLQRTPMNVSEGCGFPRLPLLLRFVRRIGRVGAVRAAMARAHDPVIARRRGRRRPRDGSQAGFDRSPEQILSRSMSGQPRPNASACSSNRNFAL